MSAPYEIIAAPLTAYLGPVGEAVPEVDAAPAGNWVKIGTSGDKNITEDGVTISHPQVVDILRMLGSTGGRKAVRSEEDLILSFVLADLTLEEYTHVLNGNTVTDTAAGSGTPGHQSISLHRGLDVTQKAMLLRGPSPYGAGFNLQYQVPVVVHTGEPELVFLKNEAVGLLFEFMALEDPTDDSFPFGKIIAQDAVSS